MNLLALLGTVWLMTTPALRNAHDTIGFLGASVCVPPAGAVECLVGQDDAMQSSFPVYGVQYAQPIDGSPTTGSTVVLVVVTDLYQEYFIVKHQGKSRMHGVAEFYDLVLQQWVPARLRWTARRLAR